MLNIGTLRGLTPAEQLCELQRSIAEGTATRQRALAVSRELGMPEDLRKALHASARVRREPRASQTRPLPATSPATQRFPVKPAPTEESLFRDAIAAKRSGKIQDAIALLRQALAMGQSANESSLRLALAGYLYLAGDAAAGDTELAKVVAPDTSDTAYLGYVQNRAWIAAVRGDEEEIARWLETGTRWTHGLKALGVPEKTVEQIFAETRGWVASEPDLAPYRDRDAIKNALTVVTVIDIMHTPTLAGRYALYFEQLGAFTSEEIVVYCRGLIDALARGLDTKARERAATSLTFAFQELMGRGRGADWLYDVSQLPKNEDGPSATELDAMRTALDRFSDEARLAISAMHRPEVYSAARDVQRIWPVLQGIERELTSLTVVHVDRPDRVERMQALVAHVAKTPTPAAGDARLALSRTINELRAFVGGLATTAERAGRADIALGASNLYDALVDKFDHCLDASLGE